MKEWLGASELAGLPGMPGTDRAIRDAANRHGWTTRKRIGRGGGVEYHIDSLPQETQAHLYALSGEPTAAADHLRDTAQMIPTMSPAPHHIPQPAPPALARVIPFRAPVLAPTAAPAPAPVHSLLDERSEAPVPVASVEPLAAPAAPLAGLSLADLQQWTAERSLRLTLADLQDPGVQARLTAARAFEQSGWGERGRIAREQAALHGVSHQTIRRWTDEVASWRVRPRVPAVSLLETSIPLPQAKAFDQEAVAAGIAGYAANLKAGRRRAYEALCQTAQDRGWRIGDYTSFTRLLAKVPPAVWDYIRKGETGFELGVTPKIVRAWLSTPAYTVLCGDQNLPDYELVEPATGEILTPELYLWMDCTSRAWTGVWPAYGHYSRYTVGAALREACRIAIPDEIFTDWGKPELSHYTGQIVAGLKGFCACGDWDSFGTRYGSMSALADAADGPTHRKTTRVGIPWQKPIENQMNVLRRGLLDREIPGFRQRQAGAWENDTLQDALKRARVGGKLWTVEQFWEAIRDLAEAHNRTACRVRETEHPIIPAEVLARSLQGQSRTVFDDLTLDLIFLPRVTRAVNQSLVRVKVAPGDLRHYYAPELSRVRKAERVQVNYDPFDPEAAAIITHPDGSYLCQAEPWTVQQPGDADGLSDKIQRQRALMRWWKGEIARIRAPLVAAGAVRTAVPKIAPVSAVAKAAARAETAKPDKGAAARADRALLERFGIAG